MSPFHLFSKFGSFVTLVSVLSLLFACATTKKEETYSASELLQQGKRLAKEKETDEAKAKIQLLMEDYP
ncbi:MAG: hypothetical protein HOC04_09485, partial [Nitrospina sp.]|nr:hypothetical protein [Nitrospina sp.]